MASQKLIIVAVVAVLAVAVGAGVWYITSGNDAVETKDAHEVANNFIKGYEGGFGTFALAEGAGAETATAEAPTGSPMMPFSRVKFTVPQDASAEYDELETKLKAMGPHAMGNTSPVKIESMTGFDGFYACKYDFTMYPKGVETKFTLVYAAGFVDGVLVDMSDSALYFENGHATDKDVKGIMNAISSAIKG